MLGAADQGFVVYGTAFMHRHMALLDASPCEAPTSTATNNNLFLWLGMACFTWQAVHGTRCFLIDFLRGKHVLSGLCLVCYSRVSFGRLACHQLRNEGHLLVVRGKEKKILFGRLENTVFFFFCVSIDSRVHTCSIISTIQ